MCVVGRLATPTPRHRFAAGAARRGYSVSAVLSGTIATRFVSSVVSFRRHSSVGSRCRCVNCSVPFNCFRWLAAAVRQLSARSFSRSPVLVLVLCVLHVDDWADCDCDELLLVNRDQLIPSRVPPDLLQVTKAFPRATAVVFCHARFGMQLPLLGRFCPVKRPAWHLLCRPQFARFYSTLLCVVDVVIVSS